MYATIQALAKIGKKIDKLDALCKQYSSDSYLQKCQDERGLFAITLHIRRADFYLDPANLAAAKAWIKWHLKHKAA